MMEGSRNLMVAYFYWWYGEAYRQLFVFLRRFFEYLTDLFSVKICIRTLFAPWKRDVVNAVNLPLQERFQVWIMNLASRFIGMVVKLITLTTFVGIGLVLLFFSATIVLLWLVWPVFSFGLLIAGIYLYLIYE